MYCSKCGSQNDSTVHFCIQCGESLQGAKSVPARALGEVDYRE